MKHNLKKIESIIKINFEKKDLLIRSLTHKSFNEKDNNEKKENYKKAFDKKISRNEPCPCGSGKKYKRCCGVL